MPEDDRSLRLGYMDRTQALPLLYPLKAGWVGPQSPWKLEVVDAPGAELLDGLLDGRLDAAFLSPVALAQQGSKFASLGGWGIASEGVSSAGILLAPERLDLLDGADVALTPEAQGSTAEYLLRLLLKPYYDIKLTIRPPDDPNYNSQGMRLLYGDDAAREARKKPEQWVAEDVGLAWWVLTGLPIVWEVLATHRDLETRKPGAGEALKTVISNSRRAAQEQQAAVLDEAATRSGMSKDQAKELLARHKYSLAEHEQKGLAHFLDMASRAGILRDA